MRQVGLLATLITLASTGCAGSTGPDSGITVGDCESPATWYADVDGDGHGDPDQEQQACEMPEGYVDSAGDCDDANDQVYSGADELCDQLDNDCDDAIDNDPVDMVASYTDRDNDGYGDPDTEVFVCEVVSGAVKNDRDCDDANALAFPGAAEVCDGVDNDCNEAVDDAGDADNDGFGACDDCDDTDDTRYPGATELCDGKDNDCDSNTSEEGTAAWLDGSTGTLSDVTSALTVSGTSSLAEYTITSAGQLNLCAGTWNLAVDIRQSATVRGLSEDPSRVILTGADQNSVVTIDKNSLNVDIKDLTITGGYATKDLVGYGYPTGGGVNCAGANTTVTIDNVSIQDSYAGLGGGVSTFQCDIDIIGSNISNNYASFGGGLFSDGGDITLTDSTLSGNKGENGGGGGYLFGYSGDAPFDMQDSLISGNTTTSGYGGGLYIDSYSNPAGLTCTGSAGATAGLTNNTAFFGGGAVFSTGSYGSLDALSCDFGTASGGDQNAPDSLFVGNYEYEPGDDATFTCDEAGCGSETLTAYGDINSYIEYTWSGVAYGNIVLADTTATINHFSPYLYSSGSCTVEHYVLSASSTSGTWDYEWYGVQNASGTSYLESDTVGIAVEAGRYYALVSASDCNSGLTQYYGYDPANAGFGDIVLGTIDYEYTYGAYTSGASSLGSQISGLNFLGAISTTEL